MNDPAKQYADALRDEIASTRDQISGYLRSGDQIAALLVTIILAAAAALATHFSWLIAVTSPFGLFVPGLYVVRQNSLIQHLGGYRKALEEISNVGLPKPVFIWEAKVAPLVKGPTMRSAFIILFLVWLSLTGLATLSTLRAGWNLGWLAPLAVGYGLCIAVVGVGLRRGNALFGEAYDVAIASLDREPGTATTTV